MGFTAKLKLAATLNQLLESKQLSEITVSLLTRESGLARRTFYDNFLDIYDFELWVHEYLSREVIHDFWNELPFLFILFTEIFYAIFISRSQFRHIPALSYKHTKRRAFYIDFPFHTFFLPGFDPGFFMI